MKTNQPQSRRNFIGAIATGVAASGLALIPNYMKAEIESKDLAFALNNSNEGAKELDAELNTLLAMTCHKQTRGG
jgi:hypothetical protein